MSINSHQPVYTPLAVAYPVFADVPHVEVPISYGPTVISADLWGILQNADFITVRQHVKVLPKTCCTCPPCVKQENTYSVYAGLTSDSEQEILRVDEVSDDWNRCCCTPYHPMKLEVRQYVPVPGDGTNSDYRHLMEDFRNDFTRLRSPYDRHNALKNMYKVYPPVMTMVRTDGQRCCRLPCKLLSTFVCCGCCQDGMEVFVGDAPNLPEDEAGRLVDRSKAVKIGAAIQPVFGGWIRPTIHLYAHEPNEVTADPFGKIEGPCFFGGWSEMCCTFTFFTSFFNSPSKAGDVAIIKKKRPKSIAGALRELFTESDVYTIEFNQAAKLTAPQKSSIIAGQLLADYMFFDGNTEKCSQDDNFVYCYCFYCNIIGALIPCYIAIPKRYG